MSLGALINHFKTLTHYTIGQYMEVRIDPTEMEEFRMYAEDLDKGWLLPRNSWIKFNYQAQQNEKKLTNLSTRPRKQGTYVCMHDFKKLNFTRGT